MKFQIFFLTMLMILIQSGFGQTVEEQNKDYELIEILTPEFLTIQQDSIDSMLRMGLTSEDAVRLSSGDIVGNGGGKAEADFNYTYRKLYKFISDCEASYKCIATKRQKSILNKIKQISLINTNKKDKMIFIDEHLVPGFFRDSNDPQVRVAKTGFDSNAPIFINLDLIYNHSSKPYDIPAIVAILIHEIGHQTGIREHLLLDDLAAIVRNFLNSEKLQSKMTVENSDVIITAFNFQDVDVFTELSLSYRGVNVELGTRILQESRCDTRDTILVGFKIENIHFERAVKRKQSFHIKTKAWITLNCQGLDLSIVKESRDLKVVFILERKFLPPGMIYTIEDLSIVVK